MTRQSIGFWRRRRATDQDAFRHAVRGAPSAELGSLAKRAGVWATRHHGRVRRCQLWGVKRKSGLQAVMSAFDPRRTFRDISAQEDTDRHWLGERPTNLLNARLNAASDS